MSFSYDLKEELSKLNNLKYKEEVLVEYVGYLDSANTTIKKNSICFSTENEYNINRFAKLLKNLEIEDYKISINGKIYTIIAKIKNENLLNREIIFEKENLFRAYLRGFFLGSGSMNDPEKKNHLEIIGKEKDVLENIQKELLKHYISFKILIGKTKKSLYIKDGEEISKFLAFIGANKAVLKFEEIRVIHQVSNNVNRIVNCETANLNKTINAAVEQLEIIKEIRKKGKFETLPVELQELIILRENNPQDSLTELGKKMDNPVSKSTIANRFKKLQDYL